MHFVERLDEWQAEWNTFGDRLYLLDATTKEYGDLLRKELGPKRYTLLVDRLRTAIAGDD